MELHGEIFLPPIPGRRFTEDWSQIPWDSELLQSFAEVANITKITFQYYDSMVDFLEDFTYQLKLGGWRCERHMGHPEQCVPPHTYSPWYIWTKVGFEIKKSSVNDFHFFIFL